MRHLAPLLLVALAACPSAPSVPPSSPSVPSSAAEPHAPALEAPTAQGEVAPAAPSPGAPERVCLLPFEVGRCKAAFQVFTYDANEHRCAPATYGGCGGNENRFDSAAACEAACGCPQGSVRASHCLKCGMAGGCDAMEARCLPTCSSTQPCADGHCIDGVCRLMLCR
jgi:Kunitz/Bovine pancreatic trypsin inhibitor domain